MTDYICCICGKKFHGWGNNPWPVVKEEGAICCDSCNIKSVVPARLVALNKSKKEKRIAKEVKEETKENVSEPRETI